MNISISKRKIINQESSKIILQPCSNKNAQTHYFKTIDKRISLEEIKAYLTDEEYNKLTEIYPSWTCCLWWVTQNNASKWSWISRGDVTLFSWSGKIFSSAVTTFKIHNKVLAELLWGINVKWETWEYIYFLDEVKKHRIPYLDFNKVVWYADNYVIQWFSVLDTSKSKNLLTKFDLETELYYEDISEDTFYDVNNKLDNLEETDKKIKSFRRTEQAYLKKKLFWNKTVSECACCKKSFPISFLVTAHIKKRCACDEKERRDQNIVMPMCVFGCDELFEKWYIAVKNGKFVNRKKYPSTSYLEDYIGKVDWNDCEYFNDKTSKYFIRHFNNT